MEPALLEGGTIEARAEPLGATPLLAGRRAALRLALIVLLAVALRLAAFRGFNGSDDRAYADLAHALAFGGFDPAAYPGPAVFAVRIGLLAPVAASLRLFGVGELAFLAYPFLISLASVVLAFCLGRLFFGVRAGLFAAALIALLPIDLGSATHLVPDMAAAFWANLGVLAVALALRRDPASWKWGLGLAAGLCFGASWLHKSSVAHLVPGIGAFLLWETWKQRRNAPALVGTAIGVLAALALESGLQSALTGDPFHRFAALAHNWEQTSQFWFVEGGRWGWEPGHYWEALATRLFVSGPGEIFLNPQYGHLPLLAVAPLVWAAWTRQRAFLFCGVWFAGLLLAFDFATTSLEYYKPLILFERYVYPLLLPAALGVAGMLAVLLDPAADARAPVRRRRRVAAGALALAVLLAFGRGLVWNLDRPTTSRYVRSAVGVVDPTARSYTDPRTLLDLRLFWGYPPAMNTTDFTGLAPGDFEPGAYVLVNRDRLRFLKRVYDTDPPVLTQAIPPGWELLRRLPGGEIYQVAAGTGPP